MSRIDLRALGRRFPRAMLAAKLAVALVVLAALAAWSAGRIDDMDGPEAGDPSSLDDYNDFNVFLGAGEAILAGTDPYRAPTSPEDRYFLYPPVFALYMSVIARLGLRAAAVYWFLASLAMAAASAWLLASAVAGDRRTRLAVAAVASLVVARFIDSDLGNGNANLHVLFPIALGVWALARGRGVLGGVSLGVAALIKVTPILFAVYLAWKALAEALRRTRYPGRASDDRAGGPGRGLFTRALLGMAAALVLLTAVLPAAALGWERSRELHLAFYESMVSPYSQLDALPEKYGIEGYSLKAFLLHYLGEGAQASLFALHPDTVWRVYAAASLAFLLVSLLAWWRFAPQAAPPDHARHRLVLELGSVAALMTVLSPLTRKGHMVVLLVAATAAVAAAFPSVVAGSRGTRRVLVAAALLAALIAIGSSRDVVGREGERLLESHTVLFWPSFLFWAAGVWVLLRRPREEPAVVEKDAGFITMTRRSATGDSIRRGGTVERRP